MARFGAPRDSVPSTGSPVRCSPTSAHERCSPASPRTAWCRSTCLPPPATASGCSSPRTRSAGPSRAGGSQRLTDALASYFRVARRRDRDRRASRVARSSCRRRARCLCDVTPRQFLQLAGDNVRRPRMRDDLRRYRYGPGVFKMDWALSDPVPWRARGRATTQARSTSAARSTRSRPSERDAWEGRDSERPYVLRRPAQPLRRVARARRASTRCGPTATSPTARPST